MELDQLSNHGPKRLHNQYEASRAQLVKCMGSECGGVRLPPIAIPAHALRPWTWALMEVWSRRVSVWPKVQS